MKNKQLAFINIFILNTLISCGSYENFLTISIFPSIRKHKQNTNQTQKDFLAKTLTPLFPLEINGVYGVLKTVFIMEH